MVIAPSTGTGGAANMPHYPVALRVWCVIAYGLCLQHQFAPVAAAAWLDAHWEDEWGTPPPDLAKLIRRTVQTFKDTGSVHDRPRSGRPHLLPGDEADRAIALIKQGYTVSWRPPGARENQTEHKYFTSMRQAADHIPLLRAMCGKYQLTTNELLRHLRKRDPHLVWRRQDFKLEFTRKQLSERQRAAAKGLQMWSTIPDLASRLVYLDAGSVLLCNGDEAHSKVLCDAHDEGIHSVLPSRCVPKGQKITVRFYVAVCAKTGALCIYFYTGTTDQQHLYRGLRTPPANGFQVGVTALRWG